MIKLIFEYILPFLYRDSRYPIQYLFPYEGIRSKAW